MSKEYTTIRVTTQTYASLCALRDDISQSYAEGKCDLPESQADHLSLSYVISVLVTRENDHRRRAGRIKNLRRS